MKAPLGYVTQFIYLNSVLHNIHLLLVVLKIFVKNYNLAFEFKNKVSCNSAFFSMKKKTSIYTVIKMLNVYDIIKLETEPLI